MADEEQAAAVQADKQENDQHAGTAAADSAGNFGEDPADSNFGEAGNGFEDNFGLGDAAQTVASIPAPPPAPRKKAPVPPVTPRKREAEDFSGEQGAEVNDLLSAGSQQEPPDIISVGQSAGTPDNISVGPRASSPGFISVGQRPKENAADTISVGPEQEKKSREEELFERFRLLRVPRKICEFAAKVRPYLARHPGAQKELESMLCDESSVEAVRLGLKRLDAFPSPEFRDFMFYQPAGMHTDGERADWKAHLEKYPEYAKLTNGEYSFYDPPQFFYRHGAIYLDSAVTGRLAGGIFYQCGAFCGASLIAMSQYKPAKMYGFEPSLGHMMFVQANIAHAKLNNLELYKMCIADREDKVSWPDRDRNGKPCTTEAVMAYLDLFEQKKEVKGRVAWIQADVGGMGLRVIKGAEKMIKRDKPLITVGIYHDPDEFFGIVPLLREWVPEYKFMVRRCQCTPISTYSEITLIAYIP